MQNKRRTYLIQAIFFSLIGAMVLSCQEASEKEFSQYYTAGKSIYEARCQNCHGAKGEGLADLAPPLTDSVFMKEDKAQFACSIKHGTNRKISVHGKIYEDKMPSFPEFAPIDIAKVMVYMTNSFGNNQGFYRYEQVMSDLEKCTAH